MGDMADDCIEQEELKGYGVLCYNCGCEIDGDMPGKPRLCYDCIYGEEDHYNDDKYDWMPNYPKD